MRIVVSERRARRRHPRKARLDTEYRSKVRALDRKYGLAQPGAATGGAKATIGPIESKYLSVAPVLGAVVGGFNKGSAGLNSIITRHL